MGADYRSTIIIPVRDGGELLRDCLSELCREVGVEDELVVVDDASRDGSASIAQQFGARVIRRKVPGGPYAARDAAWRTSETEVVVFVDMRSRPRRGWLQRMVEPFTDPQVGLVCGDVAVVGGRSLAARAAAARQPFSVSAYVDQPFFLPYFPTCNLAVRRDALQTVDGFAPTRSGGDADLCWRIQLDAGYRLHVIREVLMEWCPREGVREYLAQFYRYGRGGAGLRVRWQSRGADVAPPRPWWAIGLQVAAAVPAMVPGSPVRVLALNVLASTAQHWGYRRELSRLTR